MSADHHDKQNAHSNGLTDLRKYEFFRVINEIMGGKKYRDASRQRQAIRIDLISISVILSSYFVFHCVDYGLYLTEIYTAVSADLFHASVFAVHLP